MFNLSTGHVFIILHNKVECISYYIVTDSINKNAYLKTFAFMILYGKPHIEMENGFIRQYFLAWNSHILQLAEFTLKV